MKRNALSFIILLVGFGGSWNAKSVIAPGYPSHWDSLELGMTSIQAKEAVPDLDPRLRDMKGFDQAGLDLGDRYWNLLVCYNEQGQVAEITKNYVDRRLGLLNRSIVQTKL
jgi:hypothetical protein